MKLACAQLNVAFNEPSVNSAAAVRHLEALSAQRVLLVVFPEAYLTGYCVSCAEDARGISIGLEDPALHAIREQCDKSGIMAIVGFAERQGDIVRNTAALFEPGETPRYYRKTHLPFLGMDRFVEAGDQLQVFETKLGKIGILICFDLRPPEAARTLALRGAELIVLPTNWPVGAEISADYISVSRAAENRVFVATCDRVGTENGFQFIGRSKIIAPTGQVLASAGDAESVIIAELDLSQARQKRIVNIPGEYETEALACRNPAIYEV